MAIRGIPGGRINVSIDGMRFSYPATTPAQAVKMNKGMEQERIRQALKKTKISLPSGASQTITVLDRTLAIINQKPPASRTISLTRIASFKCGMCGKDFSCSIGFCPHCERTINLLQQIKQIVPH